MQIAPDSPTLALVMVGLPARGKSYTARRIERYLSWLGYRTGVFATRLVFFLMNLHLTTRPIWLTRHGESVYDAAGLLGAIPT